MLRVTIAQGTSVYFSQPEKKTCHVGVSAKITSVLRKHKCPVVFRVDKSPVVDSVVTARQIVIRKSVHHIAPARIATTGLIKLIYQSLSLRSQTNSDVILDRREDGIDKLGRRR